MGLTLAALLLLLVPVSLFLVALMDVLQIPAGEFDAVGHSRVVWLVAITVIPIIGPVLYLSVGKRRLRGVG